MKPVFALDFETDRFSPANMAPRPVCMSWARRDVGQGLLHCRDPGTWEILGQALDDAARGDLLIVGHNVAYDMCCAMADHPDFVSRVFAAYEGDGVTDTMLREKLWDNAHGQLHGWQNGATDRWIKIGYHLDDLYKRHMKKDLPKPQDVRTSFGELYDLPIESWPEEHRRYAAGDGPATLEVFEGQAAVEPQIPIVFDDQFRQARKALSLQLASVWGMRTDAENIRALKDRQRVRLEKAREIMAPHGLIRANGSRDMRAVYSRFESVFPDGPKTPTGRPATDADACAESKDPALMALSEYAKAQNIISGNCEDFAAGTELPIHTRFDTLLVSGRVSSSAPNLENLRREPGIRECFAPRIGHVFCACDYSKAELHSLAQVCLDVLGKSRLAEVLNSGEDPHLMMGAKLLGITPETAKTLKHDPKMKQARQRSKCINFGYPGGLGAKGFVGFAKGNYGLEFTEDQAKEFKDAWLQMWPEMEEYFLWVRSQVGDSTATITQFYSNRIRGHCAFTEAANTFFQGHTGDGKGLALWELSRCMYTQPGHVLYGSRIVDDIHDEILSEVPDDPEIAHLSAMSIKTVMEDAFNQICKDVPVHAEPVLMRRWTKAAEPTFKNGMLIPWEDR